VALVDAIGTGPHIQSHTPSSVQPLADTSVPDRTRCDALAIEQIVLLAAKVTGGLVGTRMTLVYPGLARHGHTAYNLFGFAVLAVVPASSW
jgi:hypothetical protein